MRARGGGETAAGRRGEAHQQRCSVMSTMRFCEKLALELCRKRKKMVSKKTPSSCFRWSTKFSTKNQKISSDSLVRGGRGKQMRRGRGAAGAGGRRGRGCDDCDSCAPGEGRGQGAGVT